MWQGTDAGDSEHERDVGNVNEATVDLIKDNWFFGVRAYDTDGWRSPVVFPGVGRE
ncbi:MAG: hypothetical protein AAFR96_05335 [Planctomycetota bacterium]